MRAVSASLVATALIASIQVTAASDRDPGTSSSAPAGDQRILLASQRPQTLSDYLAWNQPMFSAPSVEAEKREVDPKSKRVQGAEESSWYWIDLVIDKEFIPITRMRFIDGEFRTRDTSRIQWDAGGYHVDVCQTWNTFAMKITPSDGMGTGKDLNERVRMTEDVCSTLFNDSFNVRDFAQSRQGRPRRVEGMKAEFVKLWFDPQNTKELPGDKTVIGTATPGEARPANPPETTGKEDLRSSFIFETFWFRQLKWWNNGESIGIQFPRTEPLLSFHNDSEFIDDKN